MASIDAIVDQLVAAAKRIIDDALRQHNQRDHERLMTGVVTLVDGTNFRVSVKIGADTTAVSRIAYLKSYSPTVGDKVAVLVIGSRNFLVLGAVNAP